VRRTKILATVGPASSTDATLARMLERGVNAFRLNFSHGTDAQHRQSLRRIHRVTRRANPPVPIIADLQGPKIRLGDLREPKYLVKEGDVWSFDNGGRIGEAGRASVSLPGLMRAARPGDPLLLGDGSVEFVVETISRESVVARVVHGGNVVAHAGFFLPRAHLRAEILGPRDLADLRIAVDERVDYLALSFVRDGAEVRRARQELDRRPHGDRVAIIAKIERAEALEHIDDILTESDGIMVARGDLGIEVPLERLALEQKQLVARANAAGRIAIVATQMLLSMVTSPRPTRAEATDVANAVIDGADAVMLSEESAVGDFPVESVEWLDRICRATEDGVFRGEVALPSPPTGASTLEHSVASAAVRLASDLGARAIVTPTHSGRTARLISKHHPASPIVALTSRSSTLRQLGLVRGVLAQPSPPKLSLRELTRLAFDTVARELPSRPAGPLVLTAGYPVEGRPTNLVTVVDQRPPTRVRRQLAAPKRAAATRRP
jgi:pyruvate kinase